MTAQNYSRWFVDYPSTHRFAGRTVEVTPVAELARYQQALLDIAGLENWENRAAGDIARAALELWVCDLCGQLLGGPGDRCNSGIHQGPEDPNGWRGKAVRKEENPHAA